MQSAPGKIDLGMGTLIGKGFFDGVYRFCHRQESFNFVWSKYQHRSPQTRTELLQRFVNIAIDKRLP